ncbi:MAG: prolyl oligopeptidase family serine peptidase [Acidobacteria bacterium]|nr:prolyl oligopeptidase family serine peptidase [Acidobacteriota bacterium]
MIQRFSTLVFILLFSVHTQAQTNPAPYKQTPPPGIEIPAADRVELETGVAELGKEIEALRLDLKEKPTLLELLPDVQIFFNSVHYALKYNEILQAREIPFAKTQLKLGLERAKELRAGKPSWITQTGLVVRGYVSRLDGSVQPYGLVVPASYQPNLPYQHRLDIWYHGRSDTLTEVNFLNDRLKNAGQFTPPNAFVLHPYGRFCNANKFAGEVDTFEALAHVRKHYPIDKNRISVRGFSMGGAATWHIATHHASLWAAAAPGAGFAETPEYLKLGTNEPMPSAYEQTLWHLYNATDYAANLFNLPIVAYSGEIDKQKQAADVMARELKKEGIDLTHIIGPNTEHKYHPDSIPEINRRIDSIVAQGRNPVPHRVKFATYTLRYNQAFWVTVDALDKHWNRATVEATIKDATTVEIKTNNVAALTLDIPSGLSPFAIGQKTAVMIDGQNLAAPAAFSDHSWRVQLQKQGKTWAVKTDAPATLQKQHGLQGPIDDAFFGSFVMVKPTGKPAVESAGVWVKSEMEYAIKIWRSQFRGEAQVKNDSAITPADIANSNLILWGDPSSNKILAQIADKLPIKWTAESIQVGNQTYSSSKHIPILIFPNPLNPKRYVVLNSGFTFREDNASNARQTPKLPDWAIVDITSTPSPRSIGRVVNAGFFGERWELQ